jgi:hypothetical protein
MTMNTPPSVPVAPDGLAADAARAAARPGAEFEAGHDDPDRDDPEHVPAMQRVLDNPFLLLFIGITVPTVFYIIWGVMEIVSIPMAR